MLCCCTIINYKPGQLIRAGGCFGLLISKMSNICSIRFKSDKFFLIKSYCLGTIGILMDKRRFFLIKKKFKGAKYNIYKGVRPHVRGVAKNPIDHPHGGGQGKTSGGRTSVTPWGKITKGLKTVKKFNYVTFNLER